MPVKKISDQCLQDFLAEDFTQTQIAKACNVTRQAVHARIKYVKTPQREKRLRKHFSVVFLRRLGFTLPEICNYVGYCDGTVRKILRDNNCLATDTFYRPRGVSQNSTAKRRFQVKFLYKFGFDLNTIAKLTDYKYNTIKQYLYMQGYSLKGQLK